MTNETKQCCHCRKVLPVDAFGKNRSNKDGLADECRDCIHWYNTRILSLDKPRKSLHGKTLAEVYIQHRSFEDCSYDKVFRALRSWIKARIITSKEATAIYYHAVEMLPFAKIAELADCGTMTVYGAYQRGIRKLRERFREVIAA